MKQIYAILATLLFGVLFIGCSDDDNDGNVRLLKVIRSEVAFECPGGTGTIEVEAVHQVTATTTESWCVASVSGNIITVTAEINSSGSSRSAMVLIKSGDETEKVPVYQLGDFLAESLKDTDFTENGGIVKFPVRSSWDVSVEDVADDWVTCTYSKELGELTIEVAPMEQSVKFRKNTIKVKGGEKEKLVTVFQTNDMSGDYVCFVNGGNSNYGTCVLERDAEEPDVYKVTPTGSLVDEPYYAKTRNGKLVINFGQYLGTVEDTAAPHCYLCGYDRKGYLTWSSTVEYVAPLDVVDVDGEQLLVFGDTGTWAGQSVDGYYYGKFDKTLEEGGSFKKGNGIVDMIWVRVS